MGRKSSSQSEETFIQGFIRQTELEAFPNTNPAVIWNKIEYLGIEPVLLLAVTLIPKAHAIERLFSYVFRYDDTFIIGFFESPSSIGSEFTRQATLNILKPLIPLGASSNHGGQM